MAPALDGNPLTMNREVELIEALTCDLPHRPDTVLGSGDDCAIVKSSPDRDLLLKTDAMVEGIHFTAQPGMYARPLPITLALQIAPDVCGICHVGTRHGGAGAVGGGAAVGSSSQNGNKKAEESSDDEWVESKPVGKMPAPPKKLG